MLYIFFRISHQPHMHLSYPLAAHVGTHTIIYLIPYPLSPYFTSNRSLALPSRSLFLFSLFIILL